MVEEIERNLFIIPDHTRAAKIKDDPKNAS